MWKIAHRISGDTMTASVEDNFSDLCIAALESINGFHKKTGKSFEEMITMKLFDQYTKTCLWTAKARKGIKLSDRIPFRKKHLSLDAMRDDPDCGFDVSDASATSRYTMIDARDMYESYDGKIKKLVDALETNPDFMTAQGDIKLDPLSKFLKVPISKVKRMLKIMEEKNERSYQ